MNSVNERLLAELTTKDDLAFQLGDTLDVKGSIVMVVITFLGTQTAYLLDKHVYGPSHVIQAVSVLCLVAATVFSILELWPRTYVMIEPESNVAKRIPELIAHYSQFNDGALEPNVLNQLTLEQIGWAKSRISSNKAINALKSGWLEKAFYATAIAFCLNAVTLVLVWLTHPF